MCMANNSVGSVNYTFNILIKSLPEFQASAANEPRFNIHDDFTLNCTAFGVPQPSIDWYKENKLLTEKNLTSGQNYTEFTNHTYLTMDRQILWIKNASIDSFGEYMCVAKNRWGSIQRKFETIFNPYWSKWSKWSQCSKTCDTGFRKKHRFCHKMQSNPNAGGNCVGNDVEFVKCRKQLCPWSEWSSCSATCGPGQMYRYRDCEAGKCSMEFTPCFRETCAQKKADLLARFGPYQSHSPDEFRQLLLRMANQHIGSSMAVHNSTSSRNTKSSRQRLRQNIKYGWFNFKS